MLSKLIRALNPRLSQSSIGGSSGIREESLAESARNGVRAAQAAYDRTHDISKAVSLAVACENCVTSIKAVCAVQGHSGNAKIGQTRKLLSEAWQRVGAACFSDESAVRSIDDSINALDSLNSKTPGEFSFVLQGLLGRGGKAK